MIKNCACRIRAEQGPRTIGFMDMAHRNCAYTGGIMEQENQFEFVVDEKYENEKGVFTVLSIQKNEMVIRWESGEEMRTDIELQRNIQSRRRWEEVQLDKDTKAAKNKRKAGAKKTVFEGLKESDFKNTASGTKWRGRNQLGGAVTNKLVESKFAMNSWAFANKPEMHWLDAAHHKRQSGDSRARFFVRLDPAALHIGFSIGKPLEADGATKNWDNFLRWLKLDENAAVVHSVALAEDLTIAEINESGDNPIKPEKEGWQAGDGGEKHAVGDLADLIEKIAGGDGGMVEIGKRMDKKEAVACGEDIAAQIAKLFSKLMPLYEGALSAVL
jgi:hypothetical protein